MTAFRLAMPSDASELHRLNEEFNEVGCTTAEAIAKSIQNNYQEIVCVAETEGKLIGFCCGQVFRSMCYDDAVCEITELYVREAYRRKGIAGGLMSLIESEFSKHGVKEIRLLTGDDNYGAQAFYIRQGYSHDPEMMFRKSLEGEI